MEPDELNALIERMETLLGNDYRDYRTYETIQDAIQAIDELRFLKQGS